MKTITLALALLLLGAGAGRAQDFASAGKHFAAAQQAFAKGQFATAAGEFQQSYDSSRDAGVLQNIGESWDKAGDPRRAVDAYRRYVAELPRAKDRDKVETRIHELEAKHGIPAPAPEPIKPPPAPHLGKAAPPTAPAAPAVPAPPVVDATRDAAKDVVKDGAVATGAAQDAAKGAADAAKGAADAAKDATAETPAPQSAVPPAPVSAAPGGLVDEDRPSNLRIGAWTSVAATVALLTAGAICGLAAQERADEITRQQSALDASKQPAAFTADIEGRFKDLRSEGQLFNGLGIGLMAASGATAILSAALFVLDSRAAAPGSTDKANAGRVQLLPALGPTGGGFTARIQF